MKSIEWAMNFAASKPWNKLSFSSDALDVINEIKSLKDPSGQHTRDFFLCIRLVLRSKGYDLTWNARSLNMFADLLAKKAIACNCNLLFSSFNLDCLFKDLYDVYTSDFMGKNHV